LNRGKRWEFGPFEELAMGFADLVVVRKVDGDLKWPSIFV
jgi:hypothetical protein